MGGTSTVLADKKPPYNDTRAASFGYQNEKYCLAHTFIDDYEKPRMDFVCFGHADASHIARCSPDRIRAIAEHVAALEARASAAEKRVEELESAIKDHVDAKADLEEFERENPNNTTNAWEERLYAVSGTFEGIRTTLTGGKHD